MERVVTNDSEESSDLLHKAANGDQSALDELFSRYHKRLKRMVRLRLSRVGPAVPDDGSRSTFNPSCVRHSRTYPAGAPDVGFENRDQKSEVRNQSPRLAASRRQARRSTLNPPLSTPPPSPSPNPSSPAALTAP